MRHPLARVQKRPKVLRGTWAGVYCKQESKGRGTDARLRPTLGRTDSKLKTERPGGLLWKAILPAVICCLLLCGCRSQPVDAGPSVVFTRIPLAGEGGPDKFDVIEGHVAGAHPEQQIVLYARSGTWYVQPYADQPFTRIRPDGTWSNSTHLGTEYAALLVGPDYRPPTQVDALPKAGGGVIAVAFAEGEPAIWRRWWFQLACALAVILAILVFHRYRVRKLTRQLNLRFEERLAERTRIAQELHDTLLQGFLSTSMLLHVAAEQLPADSPAGPLLGRVRELMGQVIEDGRNAVQGLRSQGAGSLNLEQAFTRIRQDLATQEPIDFRVVVEGRPVPLHPVIRDEVYHIGREALANAFRHAQAKSIEVEVAYAANRLRVLVRDDGGGIDPEVLRAGRDGHWGLSGMRERAESIGARLKVRSRAAAGTEVELTVPGTVAFQAPPAKRPARWLARLNPRRSSGELRRPGSEGDE